ncbi:MAG: NifU N-terminal domain-containing protein [Phycisphaerales bacterium]|nr:NifU N-terminal domain-containing protein [Phycisphaerales bacterium]
MPVKVVRYEPTPNPNAIKCVLSRRVADALRSFRTAEAAAGEGGDPVAAALFAVRGVAGVLVLGDWITVNKTPDASWPPIKKALEKALAARTA